jgi:selenide,water dikinase
MEIINKHVLNFKLTEGYSAETSGGIFCMIEPSKVKDFVRDHKEVYGQDVWVVGEAVKAQDKEKPKAVVRPDHEIIHIKESFLHF